MLFNGFPECGAVGVCLNVLWERIPEKGRAIEKGFPVTGSACLWEKELECVGASGAPLRALSSDFMSSAFERPETELFQCRCSLGVLVTEDNSVKTKRGKLSVEMTDQPFVTK